MHQLLRTIIAALALFVVAAQSSAFAQSNERIGQRLIAQSGAPERFTLENERDSITIVDTASGLRCAIPPNAPEMSLTVTPNLMQCGYTGRIYENWMVVPAASSGGQMELSRFLAAYAVFQTEQTPTLTAVPRDEQPEPPPALFQIFPNRPQMLSLWLRDTRSDRLISLLAADINGHRVMHMIDGPADPVTALTHLSFFVAIASAAPTATATPQSK